tara:strand:- start:8593 stop:9057 length:465 start_codon:yes stop_codon:yes gene_type:complete
MAINETITVYGNDVDVPAKRAVGGKVSKSYGFDYPTGRKEGGGYFAKSSGKSLIVNNIQQLFGTDKGERLMMAGYGVSLKRFLFEPLDDITIGNIDREVRDAISTWEPRLEIVNLVVYHVNDYTLEGLQAIAIMLTIRIKDGENSQFNIQVRIK